MRTFEACRVVLADGEAMFRIGLKALLQEKPGIEVVAEAESGPEALRLVERHAPDLIVLDALLPERSGLNVARQIRALGLSTGVLGLYRGSGERIAERFASAGARGFLTKALPPDVRRDWWTSR